MPASLPSPQPLLSFLTPGPPSGGAFPAGPVTSGPPRPSWAAQSSPGSWQGVAYCLCPLGLLFPGVLHIKTLLHKYIYIYILYIYCPGSMHGQAEGSAVLRQGCSLVRGDSPLLPTLGTPSDAGKTTLGRAPTPLHWQQEGGGTLHSWWWPRLSSGGPGRSCPEGWGGVQTKPQGMGPARSIPTTAGEHPGAQSWGISFHRKPGASQERPRSIPGASQERGLAMPQCHRYPAAAVSPQRKTCFK